MKQTPLLTGSILLCHFLAAYSLQAGNEPMIPAKWQPDLSTAIDSAEADLKDATAQMRMNMLSRQIADMKDAQLFVLYVRLFEKLTPREREKLAAEQTSWLKARTQAAHKAIQSEGGSLAPLESNSAEADFTDGRINELTKRLAEKKKPR
jgi:uncharacterized protein YecT (DUF1311 family)